MNTTTSIAKIVEKYPQPDQKLLAKVYLTWYTKDGQFWLDCKTGNKTANKPKEISDKNRYGYITWTNMKEPIICVESGATLKYAYCKYHSAAKLLEFAVVNMNSNRGGGARIWEYAEDGTRYFINKNKEIFSEDGKQVYDNDSFCAYKSHWEYGFVKYIGILSRCDYNNNFMEEFEKLTETDIIIVGNGRILNLTHPWHIQEWYKTKNHKKTTGKSQKLLDELTSMPHIDLSEIYHEYTPEVITENRGSWNSSYKLDDIIYFEKLNDIWSVLRYCYHQNEAKYFESYRVYISEEGDCKMAKLNNNGEWIPAQNNRSEWQRSYGNIVNFDDMVKCKRLSYIIPIVKEIPKQKQLQRMISIIKYPEIEKLYKLGYKELASRLLNDNTPNANLKNHFGELNTKAKTIYGEFGLNKHQLDVYNNSQLNTGYRSNNQTLSCSYYTKALKILKTYFGSDLSSIDDNTFDKLLLGAAKLSESTWKDICVIIDDLNVDGQRLLKNMSRLCEKHDANKLGSSQTARIFKDAAEMYSRISLARRPEIDWIFDDYSDLVRVHNALVEIKRIEDEENRTRWDKEYAERKKLEEEQRIKIDKKRKEFEYEDNNYIIRLPKDNNEIVREGSLQSICIGGYTTSHSQGRTNLFFLRKKSNPDMPFYAIEMNNNKVIVQIHGSCNKWLGNDPDAIPTVVRWLRKNGIRCDEKILTCTSTGYGRTNSYIKMPVVD